MTYEPQYRLERDDDHPDNWRFGKEDSDGVLFCEEHQIPMELFDYDDESRYECPECKREDGEQLGLM